MRNLGVALFLIIFMINCRLCSAQKLHSQLRGTVVNRESKYVKLMPETEDPRFEGITIPIENNTFEFDLDHAEILKFKLIFQDELEKGAMQPVYFFPDSSLIRFTLHDNQLFSENRIEGGSLNRQMIAFNTEVDSIFSPMFRPYNTLMDSLWKADSYFSEEVKAINKLLREQKNDQERSVLYIERNNLEASGHYYSAEANNLNITIDSIKRIQMYWINDHLRKNINLVSYSYLFNLLTNYKQNIRVLDIPYILSIYPLYKEKFPAHTYTVKIGEMLNAIIKVKVGGHFIDFTASTANDRLVRISDSIKGKIALINLWASWCGPCRGLGKSMIPVYEKYKHKEFVIIGVANEYKNKNAFLTAIKNDKYPWLNLIELNNSNGIWEKYNIAGSGGCTYLIDKDGKIIAIHPDAKQLEEILSELLN